MRASPCSATRQERARNKSITRGRRGGFQRQPARCETAALLARQEAEACIQELPARSLHHLPPDLQSGLHPTVDDLHRMFLEKPRLMGLQQHQMRACSPRSSGKCSPESSCTFGLIQTRITSYLNATASPAFETAEFEVFRPTHARGNLPRQFSVLIHVSRFSEVSHPTPICRRCQGHFATYLPSNWPTSTASRIGSSEILMGISILGKYWPGGATKSCLFFGPPISDPSTLRESLL